MTIYAIYMYLVIILLATSVTAYDPCTSVRSRDVWHTYGGLFQRFKLRARNVVTWGALINVVLSIQMGKRGVEGFHPTNSLKMSTVEDGYDCYRKTCTLTFHHDDNVLDVN